MRMVCEQDWGRPWWHGRHNRVVRTVALYPCPYSFSAILGINNSSSSKAAARLYGRSYIEGVHEWVDHSDRDL
eukprot:COSAG05_NODE_23_length_31591_cov_92.542995_2_plen_73_part_00